MFVNILIILVLLSTLILLVPTRYKSLVAITLIVAATGYSSIEALKVLVSGVNLEFEIGTWQFFGPQRGAVDSLSALFLIMIGLAGVASAVYCSGDLRRYEQTSTPISFSIHYMALVLMCVSMMAVVVVRSAFAFMFAWELMTISSFVLMIFEAHKREVLRAALSYLLVMHVGFILLVMGFVTLRANGFEPSIDSFAAYFSSTTNVLPMFVVLLLGFGLKAGMFPFHWIKPITDPISPTHVAALMSGVMIKTGVYGVIRVVCAIDSSLYTVGMILLSVGLVTGFWGIIMASAQSNIKRLLAYSSVENVGIIFIGIAISTLGREWNNQSMVVFGMAGAILHSLNHSFFKSLLIMGAGAVQNITGTLSLDKLGGLARKMPITAFLFLVGAASISALPPLNGFVGEFLIYSGIFEALSEGSVQALAAVVTLFFVAMIGGMVILSFTKLFGIVFLGAPREQQIYNTAHEVNTPMIVGSIIPLAGILITGFGAGLLYKTVVPIASEISNVGDCSAFVERTSDMATHISLVFGVLIALSLGLWGVRRLNIKKRNESFGAVWGCGFTHITSNMQYTSESYSDELHSLTESVTRDKLHIKDTTKNSIFPSAENFEVKHKDKIETLFTGWWVELIRLINAKVDLFVTNKVNHYVFYALGFLIFIFLLSILNLI